MGFTQSQSKSKSDAEYYLAIPWCAAHLTRPRVVINNPPSNRRFHPVDGNAMWATTLNTPDTFSHWLTFYEEPEEPGSLVTQVKALVTLGNGITGWPYTAHGGMMSTIMDEVLGIVDHMNRVRGTLPWPGTVTAYLNTRYLKPVSVPGTILVTAKIAKLEGRKSFTEGWIEDEEGTHLVHADGLFIQKREVPKPRL